MEEMWRNRNFHFFDAVIEKHVFFQFQIRFSLLFSFYLYFTLLLFHFRLHLPLIFCCHDQISARIFLFFAIERIFVPISRKVFFKDILFWFVKVSFSKCNFFFLMSDVQHVKSLQICFAYCEFSFISFFRIILIGRNWKHWGSRYPGWRVCYFSTQLLR